MKYLFYLIVVLLWGSCARPRTISTDRKRHDSTRISTRQLDSIFARLAQRDSVYVRDSVYILEKGDTITKYVERTKYWYKNRADTQYRYRMLHDTLYRERRDSILVEKPYYIERSRRWYERCLMWVGGLCCVAAILWAMFLYLKRKF